MPTPEAIRTKMAIDQKLDLKRAALTGAAAGTAAGMRGAATAGPVGDLR